MTAFSLPVALILAALLGAAHAVSFAPFQWPGLQIVALAGLFTLAVQARSAKQALALGLLFGLGWFGLGVSWVFISMHRYGQMPAVLAGLATAAFCAYLALFPALALGLAHRGSQKLGWRLLALLPACWAGSEWLRGTLFTGFPWLASGYAHSDGPLAGFAPLVGVYGLCLLAGFVAAALALVFQRRQWPQRSRVLAIAAAAALLITGEGLRERQWTQATGPTSLVRLVQGNVPQDIKFTPNGMQKAAAIHNRLLQTPIATDHPVALTVLPESVYPVPLSYLPDEVIRPLLDYTQRTGSALIFGSFIEEPGQRYFNSAIGMTATPSSTPSTQRYSKRHLVPFGEFIPWGFRWFVDLMQMPIGDQEHGASYQPPLKLAGQKIAVNICYEDLFGREIIRAWDDSAQEPTLLLNLSNLAWFDSSWALPQHLQISRLRALETGRPMLRATNTGATAIIDAHGKVTQQLPYLTDAVLEGLVTGRTGRTPYVYWGDAPTLALIALFALLGFWRGRHS